jgi:FKBP-type peptidyl-prolyl cis-trans isomerase
MYKKLMVLAIAGVITAGCQNKEEAATPVAEVAPATEELSAESDRVAYGIGRNIGMNMKQQSIDLDVKSFVSGLTDALEGKDSRLTDEEIMTAMKSFQQKQMEKQKAERELASEEAKKEAETFLAENAKKDGVVTTESGLQYKVLTKGEGKTPSAEDMVEVNYRGTFINGEEFDSSYKRGQSVSFPVGGVIAGWTEALQLMPVGSKYELYIPSDLAYGPGGTGSIGPNKALVFEVELISIKEKEAADAES